MPRRCSCESEVITLLSEDDDVDPVAKRTGVPKRTVYDIRKRHFGPSKPQRSRKQRLEDKKDDEIAAFREDPERFLKEHANTYSFTLLFNLLCDCSERLFTQPTEVERYILLMIDYLEVRWKRSSIAFAGRFRCLLVQSVCINAARLRQHSDLAGAWDELETAETISGGCLDCLIDIERRRGYVILDQGEFLEALAHADWATKQGGSAHDLHGQPLEKCLAAQSTILFYMARHTESYDSASTALSTTDPNQTALVSQLLQLVALNTAAISGELEKPRVLIHQIAAKYDLSEPSVVRGKLRWFLAVLDQMSGNHLSADSNFRKALRDFLYLKMPMEVTIITVDRVRFDARTSKLAETYSFQGGVYVLPTWLESMKNLLYCLRKAVQFARARSWYSHYCLELRDFLGGGAILPLPMTP